MKAIANILLSLAVTGAFAQTKPATTAPAQKKSAPSAASAQKKPAFATASAPVPMIRLWATDEEVHKALGTPAMYYARREGKIFSRAEYASAMSVYGLLEDVYSRQTTGGEVEIKIGYRADSSQSHLHPTLRVSRVSFAFDKDLNLRSALNSIREAQSLCAGGCAVAGMSLMGSTSVIVERLTISNELHEVEEAMRVGMNSGEWRMGCEVQFRKETGAFETAPVESVTVELVSIQSARQMVDEDQARVAKYPPAVRERRSQSSMSELETWKLAATDSKLNQQK